MKKKLHTYSRLGLPLLTMLLTALSALAQVSGKITDSESKEPLVGAYIQTIGAKGGAISDEKGEFTLKVPAGATQFSVSFIGYTSQTFDLGSQTFFDIKLVSEDKLDEVLVIGYTVQKKSDKTGAVAQVTAEELNKGRLTDPIQGLQGKAAGVNVSKQGGDPNAGFSVNIRGAAGFTSGTGPLYVIDGVVGVDPTTINPDDIESFNVLKDAASAAIYGSRAANGVIIITTKNSGIRSASSNKQVTSVEYSTFVSLDQVANRLDFLDAGQIRDFATKTNAAFIDNGANAEEQIIDLQISNDLKKMIDQLPDDQKEVVKMRMYDDLSFKEIAEMTNVSINTALGRMRYAIINLRKMMEKNQIVLTN